MRARPASTVVIRYDGSDITRHVLPAETNFETVASAAPGSATITCKDRHQTLDFTTGKRVELEVDGVLLWGGIVTQISRRNFFPAVATDDIDAVRTRKWVLSCMDYNIWFDKRVIWKRSDPLSRLHEPGGPVGRMVKYLFDHYVDDIPDLTFDGVNLENRHYPEGLFLSQGSKLRDQMEDIAQYGGANYYIDPYMNLVFENFEASRWHTTFVDHKPNWYRTMGFREGEVNEDGLQMVTEALVWGGAEVLASDEQWTPSGTTFARYPDPPANDYVLPAVPARPPTEDTPAFAEIHSITLKKKAEEDAIERLATYGRWQRAEMRPGEQGYYTKDDVMGRAYTIVAGKPGIDTATGIEAGLNQPLWQVKLAWFGHDVPNQDHLRAGQMVDFIFYVMDLRLTLPCRRVVISFPGLDPEGDSYVRFDGEFGIDVTDSRFLWKYILQRQKKHKQIPTVVDENAGTATKGDQGQFPPNEPPDGSRVNFTTPFPFLSNSTQVYINGLRMRRNYDYGERDPSKGELHFATPPIEGDVIFVICLIGDT